MSEYNFWPLMANMHLQSALSDLAAYIHIQRCACRECGKRIKPEEVLDSKVTVVMVFGFDLAYHTSCLVKKMGINIGDL